MSENYLAAISPSELERLGMQHQAWKTETDSFLKEAGFSSFKKIAEFGCGPGFTARDLAKEISPDAEISGMDISELYLRYLDNVISTEKISNLKTIQANITEKIDFGNDFEGAFCRWFLAWVKRDLDIVLKNIYDSLLPGGVFACMEYLTLKSTVSSPPSKAFDKIVSAWEEFYIQCGGTTEVGSLLPDALKQAGFDIKQIKCVGGLAPNGHRLFKWWKRLNEDFNQAFIEKGLLLTSDDAELKEHWETNSSNQDAFIYTPILVQIAAVKPIP
jgi:ubiquinone/menaquinone biosynthesis C-methylase UbiE